MSTRFDKYEKYAKQLGSLAKTLDENSAAHAALERGEGSRFILHTYCEPRRVGWDMLVAYY